MMIHRTERDPALGLVAMDLLSNVLGRADNPAAVSTYLAEEIRELTGARCTVFIQCLDGTHGGAHRVVGVSPARRQSWAESVATSPLCQAAHHLDETQIWLPGEALGVGEWLAREGFGLSMSLPLQVGPTRVGVMLLLGLPDEQHVTAVKALLQALSTVVALVLRNAFLFEEQELAIQQRTAELRRTSEEIRDLYNRAPCGYHSLDAEGRYLQVNDTELEWLGYRRDELMGRSISLVITHKTMELFGESFPLLKQRGWVKDLEVEMVRKDGTLMPALLSAIAIYDESGSFVKSRSTLYDLTERRQAEKVLRDREARHRKVLESALDGFWIVDLQGRILEVNAAYCRLSGYTACELRTMRIADLEAVRGPEEIVTSVEEIVTTGEARFESRHRRKDGTEWDVEVSVQYKGGEPGYLVSFLRDITTRKAAEAELARANSEWSAAMDASGDFVCLLDLDRRVRRANQAFYRWTGTSPGTAVGRHITDIVHPHGEPVACPLCVAQEERRDLVTIMEADDPENSLGKPLELACRIVRDPAGHPLSMLVTMHDMSLDRELQRVVKASEQRYRLIFEHSPSAYFEEDFSGVKEALDGLRLQGVTDLAGHLDANPDFLMECVRRVRVLDVNQAALALHRASSKEELLAGIVRLFAPESLDMFRDKLLGLWEGRTVMVTDTAVRTLDGEIRYVTAYFSLCPGYESTLSKVLVSLVDITDRRKAEIEREKLHAQLLQSQKMESLGSLAGGVAHDVNNVLGAILGLASVHANQAPEGSKLRRGMETIISACQRGGTMVKGLLGFARQELAEERVLDLNDLVRQGVTLLKATTLQKVRLVTDLDERLRPVKGDPSALSHAFMNLCVNAVDAMPDGGVLTLRTYNTSDGIVLEVRDTGQGMSQETLQRALDPFFTTKPQGKGTGLGLPMVYGTVKAHQGRLELRSQPGEGTVVRVTLPACESGGVCEEPGNDLLEAKQSLSILLVDDDDLVQSAVSQLLEVLGHRVTISSSGEDAIGKLEQGLRTDAVILDVNMPGMGGLRALSRIRALAPTLPVLLATGRADPSVVEILRKTDHVAVLAKPFTLKELSSAIEGL